MSLTEKEKDDLRLFATMLSILVSFMSIFVFLRDSRRKKDNEKLASKWNTLITKKRYEKLRLVINQHDKCIRENYSNISGLLLVDIQG